MDLKYIQNFRLGGSLNLQLDADLFNVFDKQTGYNFQSGRARVRLQHAAIVLRSAAVPARGKAAVLVESADAGPRHSSR